MPAPAGSDLAPERPRHRGPPEAVRPLLGRARGGPRRLRGRLPGGGPGPAAPGRAQGAPPRGPGHGVDPAAVPPRGGSGLAARPSAHRPRVRSGAGRADLLHRLVLLRRADPGRLASTADEARALDRGSPAGGDPGRGRRARPPAGHPPPRPQAGKHPAPAGRGIRPVGRRRAGCRGPGGLRPPDLRLRPGQVARRRLAGDRHRPGDRLAAVHGPRAGRRSPARAGPRDRRLRAGGDPLRAADGPAAAPGRDRPGDAAPGRGSGSAPAAGPPPRVAARPRDDRPEMPGEAARSSVSVRVGPGGRLGPVARRPPGPGPTGEALGARREVGAATAGPRGPGGRARDGRAGRPRRPRLVRRASVDTRKRWARASVDTRKRWTRCSIDRAAARRGSEGGSARRTS